MKRNIELKGNLNTYLKWPMLMSILFIILNIIIFFINVNIGLLMTFFVIIEVIISIVIYRYSHGKILADLVSFGSDYAQVQKQLLHELSIPYSIIEKDGKLLWMNQAFREIAEEKGKVHKNIKTMFGEITEKIMPKKDEEREVHSSFLQKQYKIVIKKVVLTEVSQTLETLPEEEDITKAVEIYAVYLFDETEMLTYIRQIEEEQFVSGLIYLDNYEEALDSIEEVRRSLLVALIDRKINKYVTHFDGILKKLEKDKYFVAFNQKSLLAMQQERFTLLEEVKTVNIGNDMAVTISIGLGAHGSSYTESYEFARAAIDMALGRGGDQVVLKDGENITYYGGKSQTHEKNTRVKARVKAHALRELITNSERVIIMGHRISDVDSIGAAIGVFIAARTSGKKAHIVISSVASSVTPLLERFRASNEYEPDMFVNDEFAMDRLDDNTLLVVVDTNRPSYTECPGLLQYVKNIVVFDHHRQGKDVIEHAILSYVEPYASSTCEMIAEILQYYGEGVRIRPLEADALYSGVVVDTNNFMNKTGVRTFEAAAFLRRNGADVTRVRKMFREDMNDYKAKATAVKDAEVFRGEYAISVCPAETSESPTVVGAQAANELLDIKGVKASFVLTKYNNTIYISARSIDEVNVQIIMERLGGGGHLSIAGAQMEDTTIGEVIVQLKDTITSMIEQKEI